MKDGFRIIDTIKLILRRKTKMKDFLTIKGKGIFERRRKDGTVIDRIEIENKIVDDGLERVAKLLNGESSTQFGYIALGTGTDSPANSDSILQTEVAREQADDAGGSYEANYKAIFEKTFTFGSGESYAITEAGIFDSATASGSTMLNRLTFTARNVDVDIDLYAKITITIARTS